MLKILLIIFVLFILFLIIIKRKRMELFKDISLNNPEELDIGIAPNMYNLYTQIAPHDIISSIQSLGKEEHFNNYKLSRNYGC